MSMLNCEQWREDGVKSQTLELRGLCGLAAMFFVILKQDFVKAFDVVFNITSWFVDGLEDLHLVLDDLDGLFALHVVCVDQLLFILQDLLDQSLMVLS